MSKSTNQPDPFDEALRKLTEIPGDNCVVGSAGTGKTRQLRTIALGLKKLGLSATVGAPTNRAVARLKAVGVSASTLHSLAYPAWRPERADFRDFLFGLRAAPPIDQLETLGVVRDPKLYEDARKAIADIQSYRRRNNSSKKRMAVHNGKHYHIKTSENSKKQYFYVPEDCETIFLDDHDDIKTIEYINAPLGIAFDILDIDEMRVFLKTWVPKPNIDTNIILIDEAGMIPATGSIAEILKLFKTRIYFGDLQQLPPVEIAHA